jgi:hypothetical protein
MQQRNMKVAKAQYLEGVAEMLQEKLLLLHCATFIGGEAQVMVLPHFSR